jgi:hypothetical protein
VNKKTTTYCDHCGNEITTGGSVVEVTGGELRRWVTGPWDVCQAWGPLLIEYFGARRQVPDQAATAESSFALSRVPKARQCRGRTGDVGGIPGGQSRMITPGTA